MMRWAWQGDQRRRKTRGDDGESKEDVAAGREGQRLARTHSRRLVKILILMVSYGS